MQFYCVSCRQRKDTEDVQDVTMKNGKQAYKAPCPTCRAMMFKIGGLDEWPNQVYAFSKMPFITKGIMMELLSSIKSNVWLIY